MNKMKDAPDEIAENFFSSEDVTQRQAIDNQEVSISDRKQEQKRFMWKSGDDLRQDNLVLQFYKIMDRIWQSSGTDLQMVCYDVFESGFEVGYIEFVTPAECITDMHKTFGYRGPFNKQSIAHFFMKECADQFTEASDHRKVYEKLETYHDNFMKSLAGQCVATYILGIRDRHPGNFMMKKDTGQFFHIDFGHFLGHGKIKAGFLRDREPFILSEELQYFLKYFGEIRVELSQMNKAKPKEEQPPDGEDDDDKRGFIVKEEAEPKFIYQLSFTDPESSKGKKVKQDKDRKYQPPEYYV